MIKCFFTCIQANAKRLKKHCLNKLVPADEAMDLLSEE